MPPHVSQPSDINSASATHDTTLDSTTDCVHIAHDNNNRTESADVAERERAPVFCRSATAPGDEAAAACEE